MPSEGTNQFLPHLTWQKYKRLKCVAWHTSVFFELVRKPGVGGKLYLIHRPGWKVEFIFCRKLEVFKPFFIPNQCQKVTSPPKPAHKLEILNIFHWETSEVNNRKNIYYTCIDEIYMGIKPGKSNYSFCCIPPVCFRSNGVSLCQRTSTGDFRQLIMLWKAIMWTFICSGQL